MKDKIICEAKCPFLWAWIHMYMCRKHQAEAHTNHKSVFNCRSNASKKIWIVIIQVRMFGTPRLGPNPECITIHNQSPTWEFLVRNSDAVIHCDIAEESFQQESKENCSISKTASFFPKNIYLMPHGYVITPYVYPKTFKTVCYNCWGSTSVGHNKLRSWCQLAQCGDLLPVKGAGRWGVETKQEEPGFSASSRFEEQVLKLGNPKPTQFSLTN